MSAQQKLATSILLPPLSVRQAEKALADLWMLIAQNNLPTPDLTIRHIGGMVLLAVTLPRLINDEFADSDLVFQAWSVNWARHQAVTGAIPAVGQPGASGARVSGAASTAIRTRATARSRRSVAPRRACRLYGVPDSTTLSNATMKPAMSIIAASLSEAVILPFAPPASLESRPPKAPSPTDDLRGPDELPATVAA